jgi:predicted metal-dependent hydrolase
MTDPPRPPSLDAKAAGLIRTAAAQFNAGKFFECHDTLEEVWQGIRGPARDFFQGLIQVSVGFYHLTNGNLTGAASQLEKGLARVEPYGERYAGLQIAALRREALSWLEKIRSGGKLGGSVADLPKIVVVDE